MVGGRAAAEHPSHRHQIDDLCDSLQLGHLLDGVSTTVSLWYQSSLGQQGGLIRRHCSGDRLSALDRSSLRRQLLLLSQPVLGEAVDRLEEDTHTPSIT